MQTFIEYYAHGDWYRYYEAASEQCDERNCLEPSKFIKYILDVTHNIYSIHIQRSGPGWQL